MGFPVFMGHNTNLNQIPIYFLGKLTQKGHLCFSFLPIELGTLLIGGLIGSWLRGWFGE